MDDIIVIGLAEEVVRYVERKFGTAAAWVAAVVMIALFFTAIIAVGWWIMSRS